MNAEQRRQTAEQARDCIADASAHVAHWLSPDTAPVDILNALECLEQARIRLALLRDDKQIPTDAFTQAPGDKTSLDPGRKDWPKLPPKRQG
jgi:hypothetical protein